MRNVIDAICELVENPQFRLKEYANSHNRANNMGESLEEYVKDLFAGTVGVTDENLRIERFAKTFSYLGNQNNPPDIMVREGAAIEVKKIEANNSTLALNSSYPKSKLYSDSSMISRACRECEEWAEKDMIYCVGVVKGANLTSLAIVYGEDYCAEKDVYEVVKNKIKSGVESIPNVELVETNELGRVNRVDPLGITYLRVRGMWGIENPFKVFRKLFQRDDSKTFNFMAIINDTQLSRIDNLTRLKELQSSVDNLCIEKVRISNPNNPAQLRDATMITYKI